MEVRHGCGKRHGPAPIELWKIHMVVWIHTVMIVAIKQLKQDGYQGSKITVTSEGPFSKRCGHYKKLTPEYEKLGSSFKKAKSVLIGKVSIIVLDVNKDVLVEFYDPWYGVSGYPTLKFFPKENKAGEDYEAERELDDFVKFINVKCGTSRDANGQLTFQLQDIKLYTFYMELDLQKPYPTRGSDLYIDMGENLLVTKDFVKIANFGLALEFTNLKYSRVEIDEVRFEWAECMLDYI
ncbi:hypothetical protein ZIOFF_070221 [Zingiber officinale]|uniref:Thioredoxin domain-containing protein n=1 Tax=Zingiber officinale TaxID=94328 RepID=A0A8J5EVA9_ZINOF|nr:hypothetical protein ZIOFF_070221 [Zingiber officinale]